MRNRQLKAVRAIVATATAAFVLVASAQDVRSLRLASFDLPRTATDSEVLSLFFDAVDAVQGTCSASLAASLATERALAACATFSTGSLPLALFSAQLAFQRAAHTWLTPWQQVEGFGSVRRVALGGHEYILAINDGLASVIRFLE